MYFKSHWCILTKWCIHWVDWNKITQQIFAAQSLGSKGHYKINWHFLSKWISPGKRTKKVTSTRTCLVECHDNVVKMLSFILSTKIYVNVMTASWKCRKFFKYENVRKFKYGNIRKCHDNVVKMSPIFLSTKIYVNLSTEIYVSTGMYVNWSMKIYLSTEIYVGGTIIYVLGTR